MSYFGRGGYQVGNPWEQVVEVIEVDHAGRPTLWIGSDNRVYGYDQTGQIADFTEWYYSQYQQQMSRASSYNYGGQASYVQPSVGAATAGGYGNRTSVNSIRSRRFASSGTVSNSVYGGGMYDNATPNGSFINNNAKQPQVDNTCAPKTTTSINRAKKEVVIKDYLPEPGSEMIPLYDESSETIEVELDSGSKTFAVVIKPK